MAILRETTLDIWKDSSLHILSKYNTNISLRKLLCTLCVNQEFTGRLLHDYMIWIINLSITYVFHSVSFVC